MTFFASWLREKKRGLIIFCLFSAVYFCVFALYGLPLAAVLYPTLLCILIGSLFLSTDYFRKRRLHLLLTELAACPLELSTSLPAAKNITDKDYQHLISVLLERQRTLEESFSAKYRNMTDYYTVWAHQIKTPIAAMRLNLQNQDSTAARQLQNDLNRIEQYVNMVLTFLRLESDSTDYVIRECDLDQIVRGAVKRFAGEFIFRKLQLEYEPLNMNIITDEKWLSFVIDQILSNALKYTFEGTISIYTEAQTLCIRDTGIGISESDLPRIFENGYTGFNGRNDKSASGIGLYLCKRICTNLGHDIHAESSPGKGTLIRIDLMQPSIRSY